jgi:hypothetical protein
LSYRFPEEKQENSNSFVEKPGRHLKWHSINATLPGKTQHVTHTFSTVQQDCLTLKMKHPEVRHISQEANHQHVSATQLGACWLNFPLPLAINLLTRSQPIQSQSGDMGWCSWLRHCTTSRNVGVRFPMVSLEFFIDITVSAALWPWGRLRH